MKTNDLFSKGNSIYRVLSMAEDDRMQLIDCIKRNMPYWESNDFLADAEQISEEELRVRANVNLTSYDNLSQQQKKTIHSKYGSISFVVPFIGNDYERNQAIALCVERFHLSKNTIKSRLCDYLAFQDICIFLSTSKSKERPLTVDEKNFRWALNKYYFNALRMPLIESYRRMLKDKYCDEQGKLFPQIPSFRQFNYFYHKTAKRENLIISREGKGEFLRNHRVMLGDVRDFCPTIGYGMFDSTVCDIFLINEKGELLGRPSATSIADISLIPTIEGDKKTLQYALDEDTLFKLYVDPESPLAISKDFVPVDYKARKNDSPCWGGFMGLCLNPQGEVVICVSMPYSVGNLNKNSVKEIWLDSMEKVPSSKLYQWQQLCIADYYECYKEEYCKFCSFCPGMGYLENGFMKKSNVLCLQAKAKMKAYLYLKENSIE